MYFLTIRIQSQYNVQNQEFNLDIIYFFFVHTQQHMGS